MVHLIVSAVENQIILGILCYMLIFVPIIGIWVIHKYNWQHWEPFSKNIDK